MSVVEIYYIEKLTSELRKYETEEQEDQQLEERFYELAEKLSPEEYQQVSSCILRKLRRSAVNE